MESIKNYFTRPPLPHSAFQVSSSYLSGICVSPKEKKIKSRFILPLEGGIIQPSFEQRNIREPALLEKKIKEALEKVHLSDHKIACLIPELSLRAFVFSFDTLPFSRKEREQIIRFRVKKQIPLLPEDAAVSFDVLRTDNSVRVLAAVARSSIIREYEDLFARLQLNVRSIGFPSLSLNNLINKEATQNFLLVNIEEDFFSLVVVANSAFVLYRLKSFAPSSPKDISLIQRVENIVKEVENTVNFVEDREKEKVQSFRVRLGLLEEGEEMFSRLQEKLPFPLAEIDVELAAECDLKERRILAPLIGQIL